MGVLEIVISLVATTPTVFAGELGLNDLSVLLPVPKNNEISLMIGSNSITEMREEIIPYSVFQHFPPTLDPHFSYRDFKMIGARIDPCFKEGADKECRKQIRLVWQPLGKTRDQNYFEDSAIHTFFEFDDHDWHRIIKEWASFSGSSSAQILQIHPTMRAEGYNGQFWTKLRKLILKECVRSKLVKVTGMRTENENRWEFLGFDIHHGQISDIRIPFVPARSQTYQLVPELDPNTQKLSVPSFYGGETPLTDSTAITTIKNPLPQTNDFHAATNTIPAHHKNSELLALVSDSKLFKKSGRSALNQILEIENPKKNNPGTVDCVSCHIAQTARLWSNRNTENLKPHLDLRDILFQSGHALTNFSSRPEKTNRIRSFGYFRREPQFSQRVINETAFIADTFQEKFTSRIPNRRLMSVQIQKNESKINAGSPEPALQQRVFILQELVFPK